MVGFKKQNRLNSDTVFDVFNNIFLGFCFIVVAYPLIYIVSASFSNAQAVISRKVWLFPVDFNLDAYRAVLNNKQIGISYINSVVYVVLGTSLSVFLTMIAAYPLSRKEFIGRKFFMGFILFTMLFYGGLIPMYLLMKNLGLRDTRWAMILPQAIGVWNVIIARTFLQHTISDELYDAAQIDGCSDFRFLFQIVFPLSGSIIAVLTLFYAVGIWNSYFDALIYLDSQNLFPLQIILRNILIMNQVDMGMMNDLESLARKQGMAEILKYSLIVVASVPLLIIYPFVQKYFVKGVMVGSIKG